jgi:hypothetical protein
MAARADGGAATQDFWMQFNGDSGSNYTYHQLYSYNSAVGTGNGTSQTRTYIGSFAGAGATAGAYGASIIDILNAFSSTNNKVTRLINGVVGTSASTGIANHISGAWLSTAPITSISVFSAIGNLAVGTRVSLYGMRG